MSSAREFSGLTRRHRQRQWRERRRPVEFRPQPAAARAARWINSTQTFDPFANENNFWLAAFIFEDVGVTAYKGAAPLIDNKTYLEAAAGILAVEAYHAGIVRTSLYSKGLYDAAQKLSDARGSLDNRVDDDQGIGTASRGNLVPATATPSRTAAPPVTC